MKINRNPASESAAQEILAFLNGEESASGRRDPVVSVDEKGTLLFYNVECGIGDKETVLIERLEDDSMGEGWDLGSPADVIDWLEDNCD